MEEVFCSVRRLCGSVFGSCPCKEAREEKLAAIKVANTKKHDFQSFMEAFIAAATRIPDGFDLDEFAEPASPPPAE